MSHTIVERDTLIKRSDSVKVDSLTKGGDSINKKNDSLLASKGSIKMPLFSEAKDSVVEDFLMTEK